MNQTKPFAQMSQQEARQAVNTAMQRNTTRHKAALQDMGDMVIRGRFNHECELRRMRDTYETQLYEQTTQQRAEYVEHLQQYRRQMTRIEQDYEFKLRTQKMVSVITLLTGLTVGIAAGVLITVI